MSLLIDVAGRLLVKKEKPDYFPSDRYAYKTHHRNPIYIPVNRIKTPYQTDEALDEDNVRENIRKIKAGTALSPIVIGYNYDLHDGHHRLEAAMRLDHTHVPCVVGGRNKRRVRAAEKRYRKVWKSIGEVTIRGSRALVEKSPTSNALVFARRKSPSL